MLNSALRVPSVVLPIFGVDSRWIDVSWRGSPKLEILLTFYGIRMNPAATKYELEPEVTRINASINANKTVEGRALLQEISESEQEIEMIELERFYYSAC